MKTLLAICLLASVCIDLTFADEFSYLEDSKSPQTTAWVAARNASTLASLAQGERFEGYVSGGLAAAIADDSILGAVNPAASLKLDHGWLYQLFTDASRPRGIWRRIRLESFASARQNWQTLLDLDELAAREGKKWTFVPLVAISPNGKRCLLALSDGGWTTYEWREFDLERRAFVADGLRVSPANRSSVAWLDDDTVLVAGNFGPGTLSPTGMPLSVRRWHRGEGLADAKVLVAADPRDYHVVVTSETESTGARHIILNRYGPGGLSFWLFGNEGSLQRMSLPDSVTSGSVYAGHFIFKSPADVQVNGRQIRRESLLAIAMSDITKPKPDIHVVREADGETTLVRWGATAAGLLVEQFRNASAVVQRIRYTDHRWLADDVPLPAHGTIRVALQSPQSDLAFVVYESFLQPQTLYRVDLSTSSITKVTEKAAAFDASGFVTEQLEAKSSDGTAVPYFVTRPRATKSLSTAPAIVRGYGAWRQIESPFYSGALGRLWLGQGGVYVVANVRGGGEKGEAWHVTRAGRRHTYDDMEAVLEDLIRRGISAPKRLAVVGQSAGGLLAGVMLTRRPDLLGAAILEVAPLDQFRLDLSVRAPAQTAAEYGSPDVPEERAFLAATSPFQNLQRRADFPAPLVITSATDETVSPAYSRRFAAKLADLGLPGYFYESAEGSHGTTSNVRDAARLDALKYNYLARQLIDPFRELQGRAHGIRDSIEWTSVIAFEHVARGERAGQYSLLSPGGNYFAVHTRRADIASNTVADTLMLFRSEDARAVASGKARVPAVKPVAVFVASVSDDARYVSDIHWLDDNTLGFTACGTDGRMSAWALDAATGTATALADDGRDVLAFDRKAGSTVYYSRVEEARPQVVVVGNKRLPEILSKGLDPDAWQMAPVEVYSSSSASELQRLSLPMMRLAPNMRRVWLSPNGAYAVLIGVMEDGAQHSGRVQYVLLDVRANRARALVGAPLGIAGGHFEKPDVRWRPDSSSVIVSNTYLPDGEAAPGWAEVEIPSGTSRRIQGADVETTEPAGSLALSIELRQSLNERPRLFVVQVLSASKPGRRPSARLLFDPNPTADAIRFTQARAITWTDGNGRQWRGGLLVPQGASARRKVPLVVQTHGFNENTFLLDGPTMTEGGSAFAAQAFASAGIAVLQIEDNRSAVSGDEREGSNFSEGYRSGIAALVEQGWVDPSKVGLIGFSRTGYYALHLLAQHPQLLAAVTIADSFQDGYGEYIIGTTNSDPLTQQLARLTGGEPLDAQRADWFARNPLYSISQTKAAVRLEENGELGGIGLWETYSLLRRARRPVDFVVFPSGRHVLRKPSERVASQGGNLDWFRFWLQDAIDPDPAKAEQYARWRELRESAQAPALSH